MKNFEVESKSLGPSTMFNYLCTLFVWENYLC